MTYLVTGALGALGAWAVRSLLDRGQEVVTYDLGGSDHRLRLALSGEEVDALPRIDGDVTDLDHLERVIDEHEVTNVIHLAALRRRPKQLRLPCTPTPINVYPVRADRRGGLSSSA